MEQRSSITSLMSSFGRAYHSENAKNPVFDDFKARELMTDDEYRSIAGYILGGIDFFAPEMKGKFESGEKALEYLVNTQIAPTPLGRAAFCEESLKTAVRTGTKQYVILGAGMDTFAFRNQVGARFSRWITRSRRRIRNRVSNAHVGRFPTDFILFRSILRRTICGRRFSKAASIPEKRRFSHGSA